MALCTVAFFSVSVMSCSSSNDDDDDGVSTAPITLKAGDKSTIAGAKTITSMNEFVAYITGNNEVTAFHVGETTLTVNDKKKIQLTVVPVYNLYDDPITKWGCDQSYVKSNQKQGTLTKSDTNSLAYSDAGKSKGILYSFENGKLTSVGAVVSTTYTTEYANYLAERFFMIPYEHNNETYFVGIDGLEKAQANTVVILQVYDYLNLIAVYMPANSYNSTRGSFELLDLVERMKREYKQFSLVE